MSQKTRLRQTILVFIAFTLLNLSACASSRTTAFSPAAPVRFEIPSVAQNGEPAVLEPLVLTDEQGKYPLGLHLELLEDPGGELTIEQVSSPAFDSRFSPSRTEVPNFGLTDSAYWLRLRLVNKTSSTNQWFLEATFQNLNYVDLYIPSNREGFIMKESGALRPFNTRDIPYFHVVFTLPLANQTEKTIYLRVKSGSSMTLAFILWSPKAFAVGKMIDMLGVGLFYGALLMVLGYHVFLFFSLKGASYLYFILFLTCSIFFFAAYEGIADQFLWPGFSQKKLYPLVISMSLFFLSALKFSDVFLELKTRSPRFHRLYYPFYGFWVLMIGILPFTSWGLIAYLAGVGQFLTPALLAVSGFYSWRGRFLPARFYLFSWLGFLLGIISIFLVRTGTIPSTTITENFYRIGLVWLVLLWSLALADHIHLLKAETERANRDLRNSESRLSQILEGMPLGVATYGRDHKPKYMNRRTVEILSNPAKGLQPDIQAGHTLAQAIEYFSFRLPGSSEKYPLENFPVLSALHGEPASADDIEMDQGDKRVPLEIWASPILDDAGNVESAVVAFRDITQRKRAEAELAEYRKHLEELVEERTAELNVTNQKLWQRIEWLAAINQVNQALAGSADFAQIYEKIVRIINHLFTAQDSFIAEWDAHDQKLIILEHSCHSDAHPDLIGSRTTLPESVQSLSSLEQDTLGFFPKDQIASLDGSIGLHLQISKPQSIALVPLRLREHVLGFLGLELEEEGRTVTREEINLLSILSTDIAQLIEDTHLVEQAKLLIAAEERNRLARELHDSVVQALYSINLFTDATQMALEHDKIEVVKNNLVELTGLSRQAMGDMRLLIFHLRPPELEQAGLVASLQSRSEAVESKAGIQVVFQVEGELSLSPEGEDELYRIAQEALNNVIKHAHAGQVKIQLRREAGYIRLTIEDNGVGFDRDKAGQSGGQGIRNIYERAEKIGARCWIESAPGEGTRVTIEVNI